jgi:hypothetical protein
LLVVRNIVPLISDQTLPYTLLRTSKERVAATTAG